MTDPDTASGKDAYIKAQKQRNWAIGGGLLVFVILVFFITMARISTNAKHAAEERASSSSVAASH